MPEFLPFAGVRYDCDAAGAGLGTLAAPPYDVVDDDEHAALEAAHPHNSVRLILPRDEHADGDRYAPRPPPRSRTWRRDGRARRRRRAPLLRVPDGVPRRPRARPPHPRRHRRAAAARVAGADDVLPHERTLPKAKSDRLSLLQAMRVNVDPIWGLTLGAGLTELLDRRHAAVRVRGRRRTFATSSARSTTRTRIAAIEPRRRPARRSCSPTATTGSRPRCAYRDERRAAGHRRSTARTRSCASSSSWSTTSSDDRAHPPARRPPRPASTSAPRSPTRSSIIDAGPVTPEDVDALTERMRDRGRARPRRPPRPRARGPPPGRPGRRARRASTRRSPRTDAALVEALVVPRLPGAHVAVPPRRALRSRPLVDKGAASAAILCSPVTVAETRAAAVDRARMPQKTTFFAPKPRTGMVFRTLD